MVANPSNPRDELYRGVMLLATHKHSLSVGLQLNNRLAHMTLEEVSANAGIDVGHVGSRLNNPLYYGGDCAVGRVHVIHTNDWQGITTVKLNDHLSITNDISVLVALSRGEGPEYFRACAGYWGWPEGRLDNELDNVINTAHKWEIAPTDIDTVFALDGDQQWRQALYIAGTHATANWF